MLKNYLVTAYRNIMRNKVHSFINIFGLAIGMSCCLVILLFVQYEMSFDKFHKNADTIFREWQVLHLPMGDWEYSTTYSDWAELMKNDFPEILDYARIRDYPAPIRSLDRNKNLDIESMFVDPSFLKIFSFQLISGDANTALNDPTSVLITESTAKKLFGNSDPIGQTIIYNNDTGLKIAGVMKDVPDNSHIQFDLLLPFKSIKPVMKGSAAVAKLVHTYFLFRNPGDAKKVEKQLPKFLINHFGEQKAKRFDLYFQALTDIHLKSDLKQELSKNSDIKYSIFLSIIAFAILLISCFNFMNLTSAKVFNRAKEVGTRKVFGAQKGNIFRQFLVESVMQSGFAIIFSFAIVQILLEVFNKFGGVNLRFNLAENYILIIGSISIALFTGIFSGSYPALYLSFFKPINILKGEKISGNPFIRKILVVTQYAVSTTFLIGTLIVLWQMNYVTNKDLGFDKKNIVEIPYIADKSLKDNIDVFSNELLRNPNITAVSSCSVSPGKERLFMPVEVGGSGGNEKPLASINMIDENYFPLLNVKFIEGRNFHGNSTAELDHSVIINKSAVKAFGLKSPIGKSISIELFEEKGTIVGVVDDFNFETLKQEMRPHIFIDTKLNRGQLLIRISGANQAETIKYIEQKWNEFSPNYSFNYRFVEDEINAQYAEETKTKNVADFASVLTLLLASFGLFGLASFNTEKRTKEIGIRKVLGSTTIGIFYLLVKDFVKLILIANLIAWPAAYYFMTNWLGNFAYKVPLNSLPFILGSLITLSIALLTISYHSIKAATSNPVKALRYE